MKKYILILAVVIILLLSLSFSKRENKCEVNIYMWGGDEAVNSYMNDWVAPRLNKKYVRAKITPITDIKEVINRLITEKSLNKEKGSIDIIWINGENFALAKSRGLLYGPFLDKLTNFKYYDPTKHNVDFGVPVDGMEAPWGTAHFVMIYDSEKVKNPPRDMAELKEWVQKNPGKFTYPAPPNFTGSAFIRQVLTDVSGGHKALMKAVEEGRLPEMERRTWDYLNSIKQWCWRNGETWPEGSGMMDRLYGNGEIWITMSYNPAHAIGRIEKGQFPKSSRSYLLKEGSLSNTHYLAIPFNAPHREAAVKTIDFLLSPEAQIEKYKPVVWGDGLAIDPLRLTEDDRKKLQKIERAERISSETLEENALPELEGSYIDHLESQWMDNVGKK